MSESQPVTEENIEVDAQVGEEQVESAPDYSEMEKDKLLEELKERDEELAKQKKSYENIRSLSDKRYNEFQQQIAKLEGKLEVGMKAPEKPVVDRGALLKEMEEAIDEDPKNAAKYLMELASEYEDVLSERESKLLSTFDQRLAQQSPSYKENREFVDKLVDGGMSLSKAIEIAEDFAAERKTSQPAKPKPAAVVEATRASSESATQTVEIPKHLREVARLAGLGDDTLKKIAREEAKARMQ